MGREKNERKARAATRAASLTPGLQQVDEDRCGHSSCSRSNCRTAGNCTVIDKLGGHRLLQRRLKVLGSPGTCII
eukprot:1159375-Amphidinium_carterae.1